MHRTAQIGMLAAAALAAAPAGAKSFGTCGFDSVRLRFAGSVADTASCLLRKVSEHGNGATVQPIPSWLTERMTRPVGITAAQLSRYLQAKAIPVAELTDTIAVGDTPQRRYFVIHDTSNELPIGTTDFPANMNQPSYSGNNIAGYPGLANKVNLIVSRDGRSRRFRNWGQSRSSPATKLEQMAMVPAARPLFVHVENVQPRINPDGSFHWKAPMPGFTEAQERRLALAYVVASVRAGRWLIPAYHYNVDEGMDPHDDPQHVELAPWVQKVAAIEAEILAGP